MTEGSSLKGIVVVRVIHHPDSLLLASFRLLNPCLVQGLVLPWMQFILYKLRRFWHGFLCLLSHHKNFPLPTAALWADSYFLQKYAGKYIHVWRNYLPHPVFIYISIYGLNISQDWLIIGTVVGPDMNPNPVSHCWTTIILRIMLHFELYVIFWM